MGKGQIDLHAYIEETYNAVGEQLFAKYPTFRVFRHQGNRKWFAVIMELAGEKLGLSADNIRVVNLKCDSRLIGSLREEPGIYPGYHMNKAHWLTVLLDGTVDEDKIKFLLDMSYELTKGGRR
jgi:predicted DNA-binding protein (MmcQ/YjbR family)